MSCQWYDSSAPQKKQKNTHTKREKAGIWEWVKQTRLPRCVFATLFVYNLMSGNDAPCLSDCQNGVNISSRCGVNWHICTSSQRKEIKTVSHLRVKFGDLLLVHIGLPVDSAFVAELLSEKQGRVQHDIH